MNHMTIASVILGVGMSVAASVATGSTYSHNDKIKTFTTGMKNNQHNPSEKTNNHGEELTMRVLEA